MNPVEYRMQKIRALVSEPGLLSGMETARLLIKATRYEIVLHRRNKLNRKLYRLGRSITNDLEVYRLRIDLNQF